MDNEELPVNPEQIAKGVEESGAEQQEVREQVLTAQRANLGLTYATLSAARAAHSDPAAGLQPAGIAARKKAVEETLQKMLHAATRMYQVWQNVYSLENGDWREQWEKLSVKED